MLQLVEHSYKLTYTTESNRNLNTCIYIEKKGFQNDHTSPWYNVTDFYVDKYNYLQCFSVKKQQHT